MQPDALNLAIAQSIEKKPAVSYPGCITHAWQFDFLQTWQPRDFINDPSLSFLLLKQLIIESHPVLFLWERLSECSGDVPYLDYAGMHIREMEKDLADLGRAIAEAWARAKGIYVDDKNG